MIHVTLLLTNRSVEAPKMNHVIPRCRAKPAHIHQLQGFCPPHPRFKRKRTQGVSCDRNSDHPHGPVVRWGGFIAMRTYKTSKSYPTTTCRNHPKQAPNNDKYGQSNKNYIYEIASGSLHNKHTCVRVSWLSLISLISSRREKKHLFWVELEVESSVRTSSRGSPILWQMSISPKRSNLKVSLPVTPGDPTNKLSIFPPPRPTWRKGFPVTGDQKKKDSQNGFEGWYAKPPTGFSMTAVLYRNEHHP